ncbi:MAG: methyltransferase domain-containing protein [Oceanospirillales bacterium]|nr:methyltransferase domain-containing protein [Oceanospirillales bacterium]
MPLSCPVCHGALAIDADEKSLRCEAGHSFDRARQGYWNLLLAQRKKSKDPGDNSEMIQARRRFLDAGYYWLIAEQLNQLLVAELSGIQSPLLLDLGCGEGYYTMQIEEALTAAGFSAQIAGLDISKHAVKAACKRSTGIDWLVATGADVPLPAESLDAMTLMFSRVMPGPMAKVIKPGGLLVVVWPGPAHLMALRELIYDEVRLREYDPTPELDALFEHQRTETLNFDFEIDNAQGIDDLLTMTPHGQRIKSSTHSAILERGQLNCQADIRLGVYRRRHDICM